MKRIIKKPNSITENLTETPSKGKNISIYLDAESLQFLEKLCTYFNATRSEVIQGLILQCKKGATYILASVNGDESKLKEALKTLLFGK
ncbi:MAG: hypothetical protein QXD19_02290 [Candidatus Bathyarchaeia archaeon]